MTGRGKWTEGWLIRCGLAFAVCSGTSAALEFEQQLWGSRWGGPWVQPVQEAPREQTQDGFVLSASGTTIQDTPAGEAIKLIEEGQWVKAIQAIESLDDANKGLVLDERGVLRPLSTMKSALITSMPDEGKRAFRKLNEPAANSRLAEANKTKDPETRAQLLQAIVEGYILCDAAAPAAQQLGDIRFEQGRFNEAAAHYRLAAEHPASAADDPLLMVRRLTALARSTQWRAFDELAEYTRFRHPGTTVRVAGQDAPVQELITQLVESRGETQDQPTTNTPATIAMPTEADLEYERPLIGELNQRMLRQLATNNRVGSIIDQAIAPVVATDDQRLFTLALGSVARIDPETGTELWRHAKTEDGIRAVQSRMHNLFNGYAQSLVVQGETLLAAIPDQQNFSRSHLTALRAETGEEKWSLRDTLRGNSEGVVGKPLVIDDTVYFVTYRSSGDLSLRTVDLQTGSERKALKLGKVSKGSNMSTPAELSPRLVMGQGYLMVQTNNGALIAVDPNTMQVAWAFSQKIRPSGLNMMRRRGMQVNNALCRHTGEIVSVGDTIVSKDTRTNRVIAFREFDAAMLWSVECDADATIVHYDKHHIYLLGRELVALDRRTGERVWWTPHPGEKSGRPIFTKDACLIAGNQRLCRIDLSNGKLTHYREDLSSPDTLHVVGQQLIGVSNDRIIAIRLP
ncbi:MAG: PQQ-binding-like beta-propeller repeat protein [Planctomycetota bacterium]